VEFFVTDIRISKLQEGLARESLTQTTMLQLPLITATIIEGTNTRRHLSSPKRLASHTTATLALLSKVDTITTVDSANGSVVLVAHIVPPWQLTLIILVRVTPQKQRRLPHNDAAANAAAFRTKTMRCQAVAALYRLCQSERHQALFRRF
jgi:hypothetical protein